MEIRFTKHALIRMTERGIAEDEVYEVFEHPVLTVKKKESIIIGRTRQGRFLTLIMDGSRLLTIWPSSRVQRRLYGLRT